MRRIFLLLVVIFVAGALALFLVRRETAVRAAEVAKLLPRETVLFLHVPDFEKGYADFKVSDFGSLCQEPFLRQLLRKPTGAGDLYGILLDIWRDLPELRVRNAFVASSDLQHRHFLGGAEFRCTMASAHEITEGWKVRIGASQAERKTVDYRSHQIVLVRNPNFTLVWSLVGDRVFFADTINALTGLLDRAEGKNNAPSLADSADFESVTRQLPEASAALAYLQPNVLAATLTKRGRRSGTIAPFLEKIPAAAFGLVFDGKKIREVAFALMPRLREGKLHRTTLPVASTDTLLYLSVLADLPQILHSVGFAKRGEDREANLLAKAEIGPQQLKTAFAQEASLSVEWTADDRVPAILATLQVRQPEAARRVLALVAGRYSWSATARNNTVYYHLPITSLPWGVNPTAAVTDQMVVVGLDAASVERAIEGRALKTGLTQTAQFHDASKQLPEPEQQFAYLDWGLTYQRFDTVWRPLWQLGAAFIPKKAGNWSDLAELPPADFVRSRLGPTCIAQTYVDGGYRWESTGSVPLTPMIITAAILTAGSAPEDSTSQSATARSAP